MSQTKNLIGKLKTSIKQHPFQWLIRLSFVLFIYSIYHADQTMEHIEGVYDNVSELPPHNIVLVLGTAKTYEGYPNVFYNYRISEAVKLYKSGKIKGFLISGDNSLSNYDEPTDMKDDLVKRGVPEEIINLDYAGFDTYDSVVRAEKIFQLKKYIIISQDFHIKRALYIARGHGHQVVGLAAQGIPGVWNRRMRLREVLARYKAFLEVNIYSPGPTFLGPKVELKQAK